MQSDKITKNLKRFLNDVLPDKEVEVVIELKSTHKSGLENMPRNEKIGFLKQVFENELQPIVMEIINQGGNILGTAWLNQTIKAKLPTKCVEDISRLKEVNAIDLPGRLERD